MHIQKSFLMALGLVLAASGAQASAGEVQFGVRAGLAFPTDDLKDGVGSSPRAQGGLLVHFDLGRGNAIRATLDHARFQRSETSNLLGLVPSTLTNRVSSTSLGADYLRYFSGESERGAYLFAGLGLAANKLEQDWSVATRVAQGGAGFSHTSLRAYGNLGLGYQFNENFGVEAGYRRTSCGGGDANLNFAGNAGPIGLNGATRVHIDSEAIGTWSLSATWRF